MAFPIFSAMRGWVFGVACVGLFVFGGVAGVWAQQPNAQVKLMLERLPLEKQQKLKNFAEDIEAYVNDYDWTGEGADEDIPVTIQIFLTDNSVSYEDRYAGTFLVTNNSDIQYFDKYWRFPYQAGESFTHNENIFHPFTGFIDFYVYLILGGEYDKYGRFLGTPYFERAKSITGQAQFNSRFILGWKERTELIDEILSDENKPFRVMKDLFFLGLSYVGEEDSTAHKYCAQSLALLDEILAKNPDDKPTFQFLQAHRAEFIEVFQDDTALLKKLIQLDPENAETYKRYIGE